MHAEYENALMKPSKRRAKELTARTLVAAIPLIFGLGLATWSVITLYRADASENWPIVNGTIVSATVGGQEAERSDTEYFTLRPNIYYEFEVDGIRYTSNRISFGLSAYGDEDRAQRMVALYPPGKSVPIRYNPKNPAVAVLEPGGSRLLFGLLGAGLFTAAASVVGLVRALPSPRRRGPAGAKRETPKLRIPEG